MLILCIRNLFFDTAKTQQQKTNALSLNTGGHYYTILGCLQCIRQSQHDLIRNGN